MRAIAGAAALLVAVAALAVPASAVGLGPLRKEGVTDGPAKAFYLTLINPYAGRESFRIYAIGVDDENPAGRVRLPAAQLQVAGERTRRFVVIANDLAPGESYTFRICAERAEHSEGSIHARVCSWLTARRLARRG